MTHIHVAKGKNIAQTSASGILDLFYTFLADTDKGHVDPVSGTRYVFIAGGGSSENGLWTDCEGGDRRPGSLDECSSANHQFQSFY
jgi:hypothetical protein